MSNPRLELALSEGGLALPERSGEGADEGALVAVIGARAGHDLGPLTERLGRDGVEVIQRMKPDHDVFAGQGLRVRVAPEGPYAAALVCLPRAKAQARAEIAAAVDAVAPGAPVLVDGLKVEGIDSLLKDVRARAEVTGPWSKAHGKIFAFPAGPGFEDWRAAQVDGPEGFVTAPGVFSADGVDPASQALAAALPPKLGATVVDLGAGWGYLSARALEGRDGIRQLHLVEADHAALACARENLRDDRAEFHWADATTWGAREKLAGSVDTVIMNPPFHSARAADPGLGRAFIETAARLLKPSGHLWMVANRHLPYEATLSEAFGQFTEAAGDGRFKVLHAERPARRRR